MITADEIDAVTFNITELYSKFHDSVINDIARRIGALDYSTATAALQVQRLNDAGLLYNQILERVSNLTGQSTTELRKMFQAAGAQSMKYDEAIYKAAGIPKMNLSPAAMEALNAGLVKTKGVFQNLTLTTALAGQEAYMKATDLAYMQISTGAMSYTEAIRRAVKEMAADGIKTVNFAGRVDQLDVAVRRAAITGVSQTVGQMQMAEMDATGVELVAVSAHIGARPSHAEWQGKIYSLHGYHDGYEDFVEATGYGTGEGLMGWNCRHSFYPFYKGISENAYDQKTLDSYDDKTVAYNGKDLPVYDATQVQRGMERDIRYWKRQAGALKEAKVDNTFEIGKVQQAQAKLRDFIKQTGLMRQREREGFAVTKLVDPSKAKTIVPAHKKLPPSPKTVFKSPRPLKSASADTDAMALAKAEQAQQKLVSKVDNSTWSRGEWKDEVVSKMLADLEKIDPAWQYDDVNDLIHQWAISSNDEQKLSLRAQEAASRLFGTPFSQWQQDKLDYIMKLGADPTDRITNKMLEDFLKVMHNKTQTMLQAEGIDQVVLYRGVKVFTKDLHGEIDPDMKQMLIDSWHSKGRKIKIDSNAMSSWSANRYIAEGFARNQTGFVIEAVVPAEKIIGTCFSGYGCLNEYELVILGGQSDWGNLVKLVIRGSEFY